MEEILHAFGIDWRLITIQVFNFAILMAALWYFLYKPVMKLLAERQEKIAKGVSDAEAAAKQLEEADEEKKEVLSQANQKADEIVAASRTQAEEKAGGIVADAAERSERILEDAKEKSEELKAQALRESEAEITKAAVLAAEKILRKQK